MEVSQLRSPEMKINDGCCSTRLLSPWKRAELFGHRAVLTHPFQLWPSLAGCLQTTRVIFEENYSQTVPGSLVMYELRGPGLRTGGSSPVLLRAVEITSYFPNKDTGWLTAAILHKR